MHGVLMKGDFLQFWKHLIGKALKIVFKYRYSGAQNHMYICSRSRNDRILLATCSNFARDLIASTTCSRANLH